jgi:peptide chain release factor subunit 3
MDEDAKEQKTGKTLDFARSQFQSSKKRYTILDAPGHRNYLPMMIEGTSQADVGILVISARTNEYEAGFEKHGQTREHIILAKTLGVKHMIVVINKMDDSTVNWEEKRFLTISNSIRKFLNQVGYPQAPIIPLSAYQGINITDSEVHFPTWYKEFSLLSTLDNLPPILRDISSPVVINVSSSLVESGHTYIIAKILIGKVSLNQSLIALPSRRNYTVTGLYLDDNSPSLSDATAGENLRIIFDSSEIIPKGTVLCADMSTVVLGTSFMAELQILQLPPTSVISAGYRCVAHIGNTVVDAEIRKLLILWEKNKTMKKNPLFVKSNNRVGVAMDVVKPVTFQVYQTLPDLGRITLRLGTDTIAFGKIVKVLNQ